MEGSVEPLAVPVPGTSADPLWSLNLAGRAYKVWSTVCVSPRMTPKPSQHPIQSICSAEAGGSGLSHHEEVRISLPTF